MKRAIQCVAVLMFAFTVAFGFQVNTASADPTCEVTVSSPCSETITNGETLTVRFSNLSKIDVVYQETVGIPASVVPTIGSQKYPEVNLQPFNISDKGYGTTDVTGARFENVTVTQESKVKLIITGNI